MNLSGVGASCTMMRALRCCPQLVVETFPCAVLTLAYRELAGLGLTEEERTLVVGFAVAPVRRWRYNVK